MFGRFVSIEDVKIFVCCTPNTRYSEILERAAAQLRRQEIEAVNSNPDVMRYRGAVPSTKSGDAA